MQWLKRAVGFVEIVAEFAEVGKFLFSIILVVGLISVAAVIAVGFAGVAICLTIICCGVVYLRRYDKQVCKSCCDSLYLATDSVEYFVVSTV